MPKREVFYSAIGLICIGGFLHNEWGAWMMCIGGLIIIGMGLQWFIRFMEGGL